ncbi:hypothetical protein MKW98_026061 [Papaver atlanticum]|uniref:Chloromuconate cycloisomerase n=1 Tax=Papaver atlanticum TaxID=357466 RepID=A0AAD4RXZ9_9MAGN|nr:hypothetical protein MKW98_026061 [Papaver atlanticum]
MKLTIGKLEDANLNLFAVGGVIYVVRAGLEMALTDAVTTSIGTLLLKSFGGPSNTIPIRSLDEAAKLASKYRKQGFNTLKLKVEKNLNADIEVVKAIKLAHPEYSFVLDANEELADTVWKSFFQSGHR